MLASSSPPKLSFLRQGPFSSATTFTPASHSTLAAAAPEAPAPMMTTSVFCGFGLEAIVELLDLLGLTLGEVLQGGVAARVDLLQRGRAREADDVPANPVL